MNTRTKMLVAMLAVAVGVLTWPIAGGETKKANEVDKLEKLLTQRRDTLRQLVDVVTEQYRHGTTGFESVARATDQLIDAELELAKNPEGRIAILQRRVELMKGLFAMVDMRFKNGQVTQAQVLAAKAALLQSQIHLTREQADDGEPEQ